MTGQIGKTVVRINKVSFKQVPDAFNNLSVLGSLVFDKRTELGQGAFLDLTSVSDYQLLARDCIAALYEHAAPSRISSAYTIQNYSGTIRHFLEYCRTTGVDHTFRMKDVSFEFLVGYRSYLMLTNIELKSERNRRLLGDLLRLVEAGQAINLAHPDLIPPRNFRLVGDVDVTQPYTAGEALDFEDACRTHIRELLARLEKGELLLRRGKNPKGSRIASVTADERLWNQLPNLLWYVVYAMNGQYLKRPELIAGGHSSFNNSMMGVYDGPYRKKDVYSHLYPLAEDLIPFIILLAKTTGRNESSIIELRRDCLQELDGRYILWYGKARSSDKLYKKPIASDGPFSPVSLIKTLIKITEPLVRHASPEDQNKLLLGLTIRGHGAAPVKPLEASYVKYQMNRDGGWCDQYDLRDQHDNRLKASLRRWRVYYLSQRYKKHGQLSKISRDAAHTFARTSVGYVNNDSTQHIHERAIEAGIQSARDVAAPIVIKDESPKSVARTIGASEMIAAKVLRGEQDVFFASCKDIYNRPGGKLNTPCDRPWGCLKCANAVITRQVLPRVLAFRDFMAQQRIELAPEDWEEKFAQPWFAIANEILPKFSESTIADAQRLSCEEILYIPLAFKA